MSITLRPGLQLRSATCDTELIVIRAPAQSAPNLTCGGAPVRIERTPVEARLPLDPGSAEGTQLGKRYVDANASIELLCTRAGVGSLAIDDIPLDLKAAKPLPASD
jgi:hypothetical protein